MQAHFEKLKSNLELNPSFQDRVTQRHTAVRNLIENNHSSVKDTKLIGSLQRKTRINPANETEHFDIDIIVIMGSFYSWLPPSDPNGITPEKAFGELHGLLNESPRYEALDPKVDHPTVNFKYADDVKVEIVPAYIDKVGSKSDGTQLGSVGRGYWIVKNGKWEMADYDHEADYISRQNELSEGYLVPTIKMIKAIKKLHFPELGSFPVEIIAANIIPLSVISRKPGPVYYHDLLQDFFDQAPVQLFDAIKIPASKSDAVTLDALTAASLLSKFKSIADSIRKTNAMKYQGEKIEAWRNLFGDHFPVTANQ